MPEFPLVSVLLPVYRPQAFLELTVQSILDQSYSNVELILSDDSPEELPETIQMLIDQHDQIRYFPNPDPPGIFSNLNHAVKNAKGKYLQIFCQDDIMYPGMLEAQVFGLERFPEAGMIFGGRDLIDQQGEVIKRGPAGERQYGFNTAALSINKYLSRGCIAGNLSPVMVRREAVAEVGAFNASMKYAGDFEYWMRLALAGYGYVYVSDTLLAIRQHPGQASHNLAKRTLLREQTEIYRQLLKEHTVKKSNRYCRWYLNQQVGVMHLRLMWKSASWVAYARSLNTYPFNLFIVLVLFVFSLNGRFQLLKITEGRDY
jgi:glycosyltransferase involved in cell wall biosynthesis